MKKAISLLLVLAVTLGLSVVSFAATDIPYTYGINSTYAAGDNDVLILDDPALSYYAADIHGGTDNESYVLGDLLLVHNGSVVGNDSLLRPDETYTFDIYVATAANVTTNGGDAIGGVAGVGKLTKAMVGDGTVRIRTVKGSSHIQSAKIKTTGRAATTEYILELVTRANYGTKINDVEYTLGVLNANGTMSQINDTTHLFRVGFNAISQSETSPGEGGIVTISNDAPVILKDQFTDIAKSANYKNVTFEAEDGNWAFTGKVAGMKDSNFSYNYDPDTDLLNRYPDHEFKFVNFSAGVNFPTIGEMRIDVSDISDSFTTMYAYLYRDGKLTEINGTYDAGADQLVFRTNYLGRFIISNRPIEATSIIPEEPEEIVPEVPTTPQTTNPNTGAAAPDAMVALGLISLVSSAVVIRRKRK